MNYCPKSLSTIAVQTQIEKRSIVIVSGKESFPYVLQVGTSIKAVPSCTHHSSTKTCRIFLEELILMVTKSPVSRKNLIYAKVSVQSPEANSWEQFIRP